MKKITRLISEIFFQKSLLFFLLSAIFIFVGGNCVVLADSVIIFLLHLSDSNVFSFLNYSVSYAMCLGITNVPTQSPFLGFEWNACAQFLPTRINNLDNKIYNQSIVVFGLDTGFVNFI